MVDTAISAKVQRFLGTSIADGGPSYRCCPSTAGLFRGHGYDRFKPSVRAPSAPVGFHDAPSLIFNSRLFSSSRETVRRFCGRGFLFGCSTTRDSDHGY